MIFMQVIEDMRKSIFCLVLPGDSASARRTTEIFMSGCIPVFLGPPYGSMPFAKAVDYRGQQLCRQRDPVRVRNPVLCTPSQYRCLPHCMLPCMDVEMVLSVEACSVACQCPICCYTCRSVQQYLQHYQMKLLAHSALSMHSDAHCI